MSAYTDDRPYSIDLVSAVSVFFTKSSSGDLIRSGDRYNDRERSPIKCMIFVGVDRVSSTVVRMG